MPITSAMEACLPNLSIPPKNNLQCVLAFSGNATNDLRLHYRRHFTSFPSNIAIRTQQSLRPHLVMHSQAPPQANEGSHDNVESVKRVKDGGAVTRSAMAAAVVMACALGAVCAGRMGKARAAPWSFGFPQQAASERDSSPPWRDRSAVLEKSVEVLWQIFQKRAELGVPRTAHTPMALLEIIHDLVDRRDLSKDYLGRLRTTEKGDAATNSLYNEWANKEHSPEAYEIGLVLVDLLINQGDYERADLVCQRIESYAPQSDVRPQIRRVVINLMLLEDVVRSEVKESDKIRKLKRKMDATVLMLINLFRESDDGVPNLGSPPNV